MCAIGLRRFWCVASIVEYIHILRKIMLQNQNDSQDDDCFSLCSSCKSELRSFFSLGIPSFLNRSVSSISSILHDDLQMPEIMNDAIKTMQSVSTSKWHSQDESVVYLSSEELERLKSARRVTPPDNSRIEIQKLSSEHTNHSNAENRTQNDRNTLINMTLLTYKAQKLNDITNKHVYADFINLKSRMGIVDNSRNAKCGDEEPKLSNCIKSCNVLSTNNAMEIKPSEQSGQTALPIHNLQKLKEIHSVIFSKNNADIQTAPVITSKALVDSRRAINRETVDIDLANRRRNVCKLATRILKFSAYIRKVQKVLLRRYQKGARMPKNEREISSTDEISDTNSYIKNVAPQDLPMYNYNPLRMKRKQEIKHL